MKEQTHTFEYTKAVIERLGAEALEMVKNLGGNPALESILHRMFVG